MIPQHGRHCTYQKIGYGAVGGVLCKKVDHGKGEQYVLFYLFWDTIQQINNTTCNYDLNLIAGIKGVLIGGC